MTSKRMDQNKLLRAIARIHAYGRPVDMAKPFLTADRFKGVGTGFFISPPNVNQDYLYVLTCSHVVDSADTVTIMLPLLGLSEHPASVLGLVPEYDIAVLAVPANTLLQVSPLPLGKSDELKLGQKLTAVGYPLGQTAIKVSDGVYAGFQEKLQHTVSISPGNSGGPLMTEDGSVVGVNSSGILSPEASNVGFAVPIEMYSLVSASIFAHTPGPPSPERVIRLPVFGFEFSPITRSHSRAVGASACFSSPQDGGVQVVTVVPGTGMSSAVSPGDILVEFDGMPIDTIGEISVPWNYQKVRLQDVLVRSVEDREYEVRVWKHDTGTCAVSRVTPKLSSIPAFRMLYPPYDTVPYLIVLGLVIMPLLGNHALTPVTAKTYLCKEIEELEKPSLVISHVFNGTLAQIEGPLYAGDEVSHVNDKKVTTIKDVLLALQNFTTTQTGKKVITIKTNNGKVFMVNTLDALHSEERASTENIYTPEPTLLKYLSVERTKN
jgi:S1-C subfamily serine protease